MGRLSRVSSAIFSLVVSVVVILFLYGYLKPIGLSPSILGPQYADAFSAGGSNPYGAIVPGGVVGLLLFSALSRICGVAGAAAAPSTASPEKMMSRMNLGAMAGAYSAVPTPLPPDMTRSQFVVLRSYGRGFKNSKEIGKALSMDKDEVSKETEALGANGYLTRKNALTSKAMEILGS